MFQGMKSSRQLSLLIALTLSAGGGSCFLITHMRLMLRVGMFSWMRDIRRHHRLLPVTRMIFQGRRITEM